MAITKEQKSFIERVGKLAAENMKKSGVLASLTLAQAILESGWGKSGLTLKANALFGIKAGSTWKGKAYSSATQECYDGVTYTTITALFRGYDSWEESVDDHSALLTGLARYKAVIGEKDYKKACVAIKAAGYATDPTYSAKLISIIETYNLNEYDGTYTAPTITGTGAGKMKSSELINKLEDIVQNFKTLYVMGCFGAPIQGTQVERYCTNHTYNRNATRTAMIKAAANKKPPVYGFDCVCLIKGILWGWNGDASKVYGGAGYAINGVPDIGADGMIAQCSGVSTNFSNIVPGEAVWLSGHIGIYIGNGKVIECSPAFKNCVQITACLNIGAISGIAGRKWTKHGKLPYITYDTTATPTTHPQKPSTPTGGTGTSNKSLPNIGDVVRFAGNLHHVSAQATTGKACNQGKAKVTQLATGTKHPVHLVAIPGGGSNVYGWVDVDDIEKESQLAMKVGAKVKYSGTLYRDSNGNGPGKSVNGIFTVKYYSRGKKCGVHIDSLGWVSESACQVIG